MLKMRVWVSAAALLAGCTSASNTPAPGATISGTLVALGGPAPGSPRPLPGHVAASGRGHTYTSTAGVDGVYSINVPPGTYTVIGRSPLYQSGDVDCETLAPVTATSASTVEVNVGCQEK